jgi:glycyl-tRNA synthetase
MDKLVSLCKRRGYVYPSSEIYGGINASWDYGPLGVELKNNLKAEWWKAMTWARDDIEGIDAAILMHPRTWEASGHIEHFTDPLVDCKKCKKRFRTDEASGPACPACGGVLTEPRQFNLMFKTFMGPVEDDTHTVYLRPETCQGIYVNFQNVLSASRQKPPFGIAQIGKAFRNEISPGHFIFRSREFEQMEMQFFVPVPEADSWFEHWKTERMRWLLGLGLRSENLRFREQSPQERAHYARRAVDIEYAFPFGWQEFEGIHNRSDYDLTRHGEFSGKDMAFFDDQKRERYCPYVIETSTGVERTMLAVLADAYNEEAERTVLRLCPRLAPYKAAVFPLVNRDGMPEAARDLAGSLRRRFKTFYDDGGSIGRRYRRQDEAGTPFCLTVDGQTLQDRTVTVRERDSMQQTRCKMEAVPELIAKRIEGPASVSGSPAPASP